jgi:hypothetical protein
MFCTSCMIICMQNQQEYMYSSSDEPHNWAGLSCGGRIRNYATTYGHTDIKLQVTHLIVPAAPRRLGAWSTQIVSAAPVENPATAGALINSTFYGNVCVSGGIRGTCSLTIHPSLKRPIPRMTSPTRKPTAVAIVCASYLSPSGPL